MRSISSLLRVSLSNKNGSDHFCHCLAMVVCPILPFCSLILKFLMGYLCYWINFSLAKYMIEHPMVYIFSSMTTLQTDYLCHI